jgi:hypothetical protein
MATAMPMHLITLARWLARKAVKAQWRLQGRQVKYIPIQEITEASNQYLVLHRNELIREAWEHPYAKALRLQRRLSLARKAVIAEVRHKGRKVKSIAPEELQRMIDAYLEDHPEEGAVLRELGCF